MTEGQGFDDLYLKGKSLHIDTRQINFTNGAVRVQENSVSTFYVPQPTNLVEGIAGKGILLNQVDFNDALDFYAGFKRPDAVDPRRILKHRCRPWPWR